MRGAGGEKGRAFTRLLLLFYFPFASPPAAPATANVGSLTLISSPRSGCMRVTGAPSLSGCQRHAALHKESRSKEENKSEPRLKIYTGTSHRLPDFINPNRRTERGKEIECKLLNQSRLQCARDYFMPCIISLFRLKLDTVGKCAISLSVFYTQTRISSVALEPSRLFSCSPLHFEEMNAERRRSRS